MITGGEEDGLINPADREQAYTASEKLTAQ